MTNPMKLAGKENELVKLYEEGKTTYELAQIFNVSQMTIYKTLKRLDCKVLTIKERAVFKAKKLQQAILDYLKQNGYTNYKDLMQKFNLTEVTLRRHLKAISENNLFKFPKKLSSLRKPKKNSE
jgi:DeoR/GlpR family transcriptional regulator of sugar metabolism